MICVVTQIFFTDALNLTTEWLKRHVNFEKITEPFNDIIVRAYMEIFNWDENVIFPEVIYIKKSKFYFYIYICTFL